MMRALLFTTLFLLNALAAAAQTITGRVLDAATRTGAAGVLVIAIDSANVERARATSDSAGAFRMTNLGTGVRRLRATRFGYADLTSQPFRIGANEIVSIDVPMVPVGFPVTPVTVTARRQFRDSRLADFYSRLEYGQASHIGAFVTRQQIDSVNLPFLTDYIARIAKVPVEGMGDNAYVPGLSGIGCYPAVYLDGSLLTDQYINRILSPAQFEGIEIYRSANQAPPEYASGRCGVILLWSRNAQRGGVKTKPMNRTRWIVGGALVAFIGVMFATQFHPHKIP